MDDTICVYIVCVSRLQQPSLQKASPEVFEISPTAPALQLLLAVLGLNTLAIFQTVSSYCSHGLSCHLQVKRDHHDLFKQYAPIWAKEEVERASLWTSFLLSFAPEAQRQVGRKLTKQD